MSYPKKILLIGDYISDIAYTGSIRGKDNDNHNVDVFMANNIPTVTNGGIGYISDLLQNFFSKSKLHQIHTSKRTIARYRDVTINRLTNQIEQLPLYSNYQQLTKEINLYLDKNNPDLIYIWLDECITDPYRMAHSFPDIEDAIKESINKRYINKKKFPLIVIDYYSGTIELDRGFPVILKDYNIAVNDRNKIQINHYDDKHMTNMWRVFEVLYIYTSSKETRISTVNNQFDYNLEHDNPTCNPIDTCGAGDTLVTSFLKKIYDLNLVDDMIEFFWYTDGEDHLDHLKLKEALIWAQSAAYLTINQIGTYIPSSEDIETQYQLFKSIINSKESLKKHEPAP